MSDQEEKDALDLDENGCAPDCPIRILGEQSGVSTSGSHSEREMDRKAHGMFAGGIATPDNWYGDTGTASRYFKTFRPMVDDYVTSCYNARNNVEVNQCQKSHIHGESLESQMEDGIANGDTLGTENNIVNLSTDGYGNKSTDLSPQDMKYTISTTTKPTTDLKTSNVLQQRNITTITSDSERTTASMKMELKSDGVDTRNTGSLLTTSTSDGQEPITDIANHVVLRNLESGGTRTENIREKKDVNGERKIEKREATLEVRTSEVASNKRYFAQFYPDDETSQERGETQLLNSDEVMSGDLPIDQVIHGDCRDILRRLPPNSIDSIVCDPPGNLAFMGKQWDTFGTRENFIAFLTEVFSLALKCLKNGGHAFVWALPRTSHWTATALENAGFEIRDEVSHLFGSDAKVQAFVASLNEEQRNAFAQIMDSMGAPAVTLACFGSGFPKSLSVSAAIDKHFKAEREVIGPGQWANRGIGINGPTFKHDTSTMEGRNITAPATDLAKKYSGFGSALKPSHENWLLVRKPLAEKTIAAQVLATGTGALNIDISRIRTTDNLNGGAYSHSPREDGLSTNEVYGKYRRMPGEYQSSQGRFPSNTLFSHSPACVALGEKRVRANGPACTTGSTSTKNAYGEYSQRSKVTHRDEDGCETVQAWECAEDCPVAELDRQSGVSVDRDGKRKAPNPGSHFGNGKAYTNNIVRRGDQGGASRYFQCFPPVEDMVPFTYQSKSSRKERNAGCEALPAGHKQEIYGNGLNTATKLDPAMHTTEGVANRPIYQNGHPTVKPLSLVKYLCNMITPPGGIVLDMFAGSGTTGVAAVQCGFHYILIEQEQEYIDICRARLAHAHAGSHSHGKREPIREKAREHRVFGDVGQKASRCPEHDASYPSGSNNYTCGCKIVRGKASATPATRERPVDTRPTLWEVQE